MINQTKEKRVVKNLVILPSRINLGVGTIVGLEIAMKASTDVDRESERRRLDLVLAPTNPEKIFQVGNVLESTSTILTNNLLESTSKGSNSNPRVNE